MTTIPKKSKRVKKKEKTWEAELFDTSKPTAKFRKARIKVKRRRSFNERRKLDFDWDRDIDARLEGVVFRKSGSIGFRNLGVDNLDDVMEHSDWPKTGKAKIGESNVKKRWKNYEKRWGKDKTREEDWGVRVPLQNQRKVIATPVAEKAQVIEEKSTQSNFIEKKKAFTYNEYGLAQMKAGDLVGAMRYFMEAIRIDPNENVYRLNFQKCKELYDSGRKGRVK